MSRIYVCAEDGGDFQGGLPAAGAPASLRGTPPTRMAQSGSVSLIRPNAVLGIWHIQVVATLLEEPLLSAQGPDQAAADAL